MAGQRVDLQTAAELLGISSDAVRKRAKRGTIPYETGVDGKLYVWVDEGVPSPGETDDYPREAGDHREELVEELREQVAFLRRELEAERNAHAEARRIAYTLAQRIPELEPPQGTPSPEPRGPETDAETYEGVDAPTGQVDRETASSRPRSWWRRFFGFDDRGSG
jgi:hypothetical protein